MLEDQLWAFGKDLIRLGQIVIFEKGLWLRSERDEKRREARELGIDIELHYFDVPVGELARRLEIRNAAARASDCPVTREQVTGFARRFQPPDEAELSLFARSVVHTCGLRADGHAPPGRMAAALVVPRRYPPSE